MASLVRKRVIQGLAAIGVVWVTTAGLLVAGTSPASVVGHGTVEGIVRLGGDKVVSPSRVENTTDPAVCGRIKTKEDLLVSAENRGIENVILALTDVPQESIPTHEPERLVLS